MRPTGKMRLGERRGRAVCGELTGFFPRIRRIFPSGKNPVLSPVCVEGARGRAEASERALRGGLRTEHSRKPRHGQGGGAGSEQTRGGAGLVGAAVHERRRPARVRAGEERSGRSRRPARAGGGERGQVRTEEGRRKRANSLLRARGPGHFATGAAVAFTVRLSSTSVARQRLAFELGVARLRLSRDDRTGCRLLPAGRKYYDRVCGEHVSGSQNGMDGSEPGLYQPEAGFPTLTPCSEPRPSR